MLTSQSGKGVACQDSESLQEKIQVVKGLKLFQMRIHKGFIILHSRAELVKQITAANSEPGVEGVVIIADTEISRLKYFHNYCLFKKKKKKAKS